MRELDLWAEGALKNLWFQSRTWQLSKCEGFNSPMCIENQDALYTCSAYGYTLCARTRITLGALALRHCALFLTQTLQWLLQRTQAQCLCLCSSTLSLLHGSGSATTPHVPVRVVDLVRQVRSACISLTKIVVICCRGVRATCVAGAVICACFRTT